jgi:hypothetical protein
MKLYLICLLFSLTNLLSASQIHGFISDTSKNAIPYASVYVENSSYGVSANHKGEFFLELTPGNYHLIISAIGYENKLVEITHQASQTLHISLKHSDVNLEQININIDGENPAYAIIRKAIEAKKKFRSTVNSFTCDNYIKASIEQENAFVIQKNKAKLNFIESFSKIYFQAPETYKEHIIAYNDLSPKSNNQFALGISVGSDFENSKFTAVNPDLFYTHFADAQFNFYHNLINESSLSETPITSPLSSNTFLSYQFSLLEIFYENGVETFKIKVSPKREHGSLFEGIIFIEGEHFTLKSVELNINPNALFYFSKFTIIQNYQLFEKQYLLPVRREFTYEITSGNKIKYGNTVAIHTNYKLNIEHDKNTFNNAIYITSDNAYDYSLNQWDSIRPVSLKQQEYTFIQEQDSVKKALKSPALQDSLDKIRSKINVENIFLNGLTFNNRNKKISLYIQPMINSINPLGVGGYRHKVGTIIDKEWGKAKRIENDAEISFGFNNLDLKGEIKTKYTYAPKKFAKAMIKGGSVFDIITYQQNISNLFSRRNFVERNYVGFGHEVEISNGVFFDFETEFAQVNSIEGYTLSNWSNNLFPDNSPENFDSYRELFLDFNLLLRIKQQYYIEPNKKIIVGSKYPEIDIHYRKGVPRLFNSIVDFDYLELKIKDDVQLGQIGNMKYRFRSGTFLSKENIRIMDLKYFRGSDSFFFSDPLNTFQLLGPTLSSTNTFAQAHFIHHFNGLFLNKIPLINKLKLGTIGGVEALLIQDNNFQHMEAFVGIEKSFRIRKQRYKLSALYVAADSNHSKLASGFKFGIDFYNFFTNSWSY